MVCVPKTVLMHSLFAVAVGTAEVAGPPQGSTPLGDHAAAVKLLFARENNAICGGGKIRKLLTEMPTASSFRCNQWTSIDGIATAYLKQVEVDIGKLTKEIERLESELKNAIEKTAAKEWDIKGSAKPILESILTEAFVSPAAAKEVKCGQAPLKIRRKFNVKAKAFRTAKSLMTQKLEAVFKEGEVRIGDKPGDSMKIIEMCGSLLGWNPAQQDDESYCDELCGNFAREALDLSAKYAGSYAGQAVKDIQDQLDKVMGDLKYNQAEEDECKRAFKALSAFSDQLAQLNNDIEAKHNLRLEAQDSLDEADEELEDLLDVGEDKADILAKAVEDFGLSAKTAAEASQIAAAAKKTEKIANDRAADAKKALMLAGKELMLAQAASIALDEIKGLVTQTMLKMVAHYEVSVVQPVQTLGLQLATDISEYFDGVLDEATSEKEAVFSTLNLMDKYCETTALGHFKRIQSKIDLSPLCPKDNAKAVGGQIDTMVKQRATEVQTALESVRSALDVYKDQEGMTKAESDRLTSLGELEGLREVATVYGKSEYFSKYLSHWKYDAVPPKFLDMVLNLKLLVETLEITQAKLTAELQKCQLAAEAALAERKKMVLALKSAIQAQEVAKGKEVAAQKEVDAQEKLIEGKESDLQRLQAAFDAATAAYKAAKNLLVSTHKRGTNLS